MLFVISQNIKHQKQFKVTKPGSDAIFYTLDDVLQDQHIQGDLVVSLSLISWYLC
ncbi:uncharacterized protein ASCRUDRAFT_78339 [Ascoidea rubescens DSM 1968]|uniref:Uncharacterized protein n=1 Tax=Ascoidea rubescens DSM 1968 TaxID=1344418 RepID=A0A1D2V863_9ASCO|nr:hypothetical protein ASCRUDRAFT_78339 [Ascoidea rubescens DSM 1968]ODV57861.1 hypothetical protein ASCRUDRAFT_78339 [Ascoidea rubescens DSM 1968]